MVPALIFLEDYNGDWTNYLDAIYRAFQLDWGPGTRPKEVFGLRLGLKRFPESQGKSATFWHLIQSGDDESHRTPDLRRCERIKWPRAVTDNLKEGVACMG